MPQQYKNIEDPYKWALETAVAVRAKDWDAIDRKALLDELESSIAGGLRLELHQYMVDMLRARLSLKSAPKTNRKRNEGLLRKAVHGMHDSLWACPSLREVITQDFVAEAYKDAKYIIGNTVRLPKRCPYPPEQLLKEAEALDIDEL